MQNKTTIVLLLSALTVDPAITLASGHGPVFGGATPTLGRHGWAFDQAWMGQSTDRADRGDQQLRTMISFGITERLQISASLPIPLTSPTGLPTGRTMAMMSGNHDVEMLLGWRFHSRPVGEGGRFESTVYLGGTAPLEETRAGIRTSPGIITSFATGYASRSHYLWGGASYQRSTGDGGDALGNVTSYSVVYGYRPPGLRLDYPKPDLRFFVEAVGDITSNARHNGAPMHGTDGHVFMIGPTALLLYKAYGIEGGVLFPIHQRAGRSQPRERFRFGVNVSYFFWLK